MEGYYTGRISSIDAKSGYVKVTYPRENNIVSDWLPLTAHEYNMPEIGSLVATILDAHGNGVCLGKIYSNGQKPPADDGYVKVFENVKIKADNKLFMIELGEATISYNSDSGVLRISAPKIVLDGYEMA